MMPNIYKYIRTSKLHYLVNETKYPAFMTIRKRFIKWYEDSIAQKKGFDLEALFAARIQKSDNRIKTKILKCRLYL
jgi:hypothetical protein